MAKLTLTLSEPEVRLILDHDVVMIVDYNEWPEYDEARYELCKRISDCTYDQPFALNACEAQALLDALSERDPRTFTVPERQVFHGLVADLESVPS